MCAQQLRHLPGHGRGVVAEHDPTRAYWGKRQAVWFDDVRFRSAYRTPKSLTDATATLFAVGALLFIGLPAGFLLVGSFILQDGSVGIQNYVDIGTGAILPAFENSIFLSLATATIGALFGFPPAAKLACVLLPQTLRGFDLPLNFHPAAVRVSTVSVTPFGAG